MEYKELLEAPRAYWNLSKKCKAEICNGVGPKGFGFLIPETMWGLNVSEAANIHDYMYHMGKDLVDKKMADKTFLRNLLAIIDEETKWEWVKVLRRHRAKLMYKAVKSFGESAFWENKNAS